MAKLYYQRLFEIDVPCKNCGGSFVNAALIDGTAQIQAYCAEKSCGADRQQLPKWKYGHHWGFQQKREPRDKRFILDPFEAEDTHLRDHETCAHCAQLLFTDEAEAPVDLRPAPVSYSRELPGQLDFGIVASAAPKVEPWRDRVPRGVGTARRKLPRSIDHLIQEKTTVAMEAALTEIEFEYLSRYWVLTSCPPCNSRRQIPANQLLMEPAASIYTRSIIKLYTDHLLMSHVEDPLKGMRFFLAVLAKIRYFLTKGELPVKQAS